MFTLEQIKYIAEEVERQGDGPVEVYYMAEAWKFAQEKWAYTQWEDKPIGKIIPLTIDLIEATGKMVEPVDNAKGFRTIPIYVGNGFEWIEKAPPERIQEQLTILLQSYYEGYLNPGDTPTNPLSKTAEDEFYFQFENIHPFKDGNGRTGKIIYNYLCGTLERPTMPPNFWGSSNP